VLVRALPAVTDVQTGRPIVGRPVRGRLVVRYSDGHTTTHGAWTWTHAPSQFETWCGKVNPGARSAARAIFVATPNVPLSCLMCKTIESTTGVI
jgi:hypothetical protein